MSQSLTTSSLPTLRARPSLWTRFRGFAQAKPLGVLGLFLVVGATLLAIFAPWLVRYPPEQVFGGFQLSPPSARFWLGTDEVARDVFSRVLYGSRVSLFVGLTVVLIGTTLGGALGILSAYLGGKWDLLIQRLVDMVISFPALILALAVMAALGQSVANVVIALTIVQVPGCARTLRSVALSIKEMQYVEAARAIGASDIRILTRYLAVNCVAPFIVVASVTLGNAIVAEASLSFLGVGTPRQIPSWGSMLGGATQQYVAIAPWLGIFPGLALSLTVFGINLLGDALRDVLDPRLRGSR